MNENANANANANANEIKEPREAVSAKRAILPFIVASLLAFCSCLFSGIMVILPFLSGAIAGGIYASILLFAEKKTSKKALTASLFIIPAAVCALSLLFCFAAAHKGDGGDKVIEYHRVLASVFSFAIGAAVYIFTKKGETRSNITIAGAVCAGVLIIACAALKIYETRGALDLDTIKSVYYALRENVVSSVKSVLDAQSELLTQYGVEDPAAYASDYLAMLDILLDNALCLSPALFICFCEVLSYICVISSHRIAKRIFLLDIDKKSRELRVSVIGAFIFGVSYIIYVAASFFSESPTVVGVVCGNLYLIYTPALALTAFIAIIRNRRTNPGIRSTLTLIIAVVLLVFNFSLALSLLAFFGALNIVGQWAYSKISGGKQ